MPATRDILTFGRSQTTLGSGNLSLLLQQYCGNAGARFGRRLAAALPLAAARDIALDSDLKLHNVLRATADNPVMRDVQDVFFNNTFFDPAMRTADREGMTSPLGKAVVYDSFVHGAWARIRARVEGTPGESRRAGMGDVVRRRAPKLAGDVPQANPARRSTAWMR